MRDRSRRREVYPGRPDAPHQVLFASRTLKTDGTGGGRYIRRSSECREDVIRNSIMCLSTIMLCVQQQLRSHRAPVSGTSPLQMESKQPRVHQEFTHDSAMKIAHPEHASQERASEVHLSTTREHAHSRCRRITTTTVDQNVSSCFCAPCPTRQCSVSRRSEAGGKLHFRYAGRLDGDIDCFTTTIRWPQALSLWAPSRGRYTHPSGGLQQRCSDAVEIFAFFGISTRA